MIEKGNDSMPEFSPKAFLDLFEHYGLSNHERLIALDAFVEQVIDHLDDENLNLESLPTLDQIIQTILDNRTISPDD